MTCLRVPKISGKVTIYGVTKADYSGITVTIAEKPEFKCTTSEDGTYCFTHVPVGTYTFEFTRENARKVTKIVAVEAAPEIKIEDIELIPDAVTLYGNISLRGVADYSGVTVRITTPDSVDLKTVTNAAGYWYISNIVASKSHTITFEKNGWNSQEFNIEANAYEALSTTDFNKDHAVSLEDTVPPVITSITATVGKSTEEGREIYLYLHTQEEGSGVKYIQGNVMDTFDNVTEHEYYNPFKLIIPDELGEKTLYVRVKDAAGNISNTVSTNIVLKNDKVELYQTLREEKLHLKAEDENEEPIVYLVTDNVLVPEGETLIIDPGVEIQINGAYFIQVEGTLNAVGTEDRRIKIYGVDDGADNWLGVKILSGEAGGNKISYADITGMKEGIQGYCDIDNSNIIAASSSYRYGYALGVGVYGSSNKYYGNISKSVISGKIDASVTEALGNEIASDSINLAVSSSLYDNNFTGTLSGTISGNGTIIHNTFKGSGTLTFDSLYMMNNLIKINVITSKYCKVSYSTFNGCALSIQGGYWTHDNLKDCTFTSYSAGSFTDSNIIDCGTITITSKRSDVASYSMVRNYWGSKTIELEQKTSDDKITFIYHNPDDFNLTKVIWDNYLKTELTPCGYQEQGIEITAYAVGDRGPAGGYIIYDCDADNESGNADGLISTQCGWRYLEANTIDIGSYPFGYYRPDGNTSTMLGTSTGIGTGKKNTEALVEAMGKQAYVSSYSDKKGSYAAKACQVYSRSYQGVVYDDWFLPSKDELNLVYRVCGGSDGWHWSSSEFGDSNAWGQSFNVGSQDLISRKFDDYVRPVRAFL